MNESSRTDWDRIGAMSDEAIDTSDIPPLSKTFFDQAMLHTPQQPSCESDTTKPCHRGIVGPNEKG